MAINDGSNQCYTVTRQQILFQLIAEIWIHIIHGLDTDYNKEILYVRTSSLRKQKEQQFSPK